MFQIALYEPEIPPNTGNIMRLVANTGCQLHLIKPLGFEVNEKQCRRAALDYREFANVLQHESYVAFCENVPKTRIFACTTKASTLHTAPQYQPGDVFLLGPETRGLPETVLQNFPKEQQIRIPMLPTSRSLNLANAAAIIVYEAWRQLQFAGS